MRNKVYLSLVHYPVYNRNKDIVCTSVTNFDIHDISRSCGTYEIKGYRLVVPVDAQKKLTERIIGYWQDGTGGQYNKDREQAFRVTDVTESIEAVVEEIEKIEGQKPLIINPNIEIVAWNGEKFLRYYGKANLDYNPKIVDKTFELMPEIEVYTPRC